MYRTGRPRIVFEPLSSLRDINMKSEATRLRFLPHYPRKASFCHPISSLNSLKGNIPIPGFTRTEDSIDQRGNLSWKCLSCSFFRFTPLSQSVVEVPESRVTPPSRSSGKDKSHLKPFIPLPCHPEKGPILSGLINNWVKTYVADEILFGRESFHRVSDLPYHSSHSYFTNSWDGEKNMVWVVGIHDSFDLFFYLFNLLIQLDDSFCSPFHFIPQKLEHSPILKKTEKRKESSEGRMEGREILWSLMKGDKSEEIRFELLTKNSFVTREKDSEVFPETIYTPCPLLNESSPEAGKGADEELLRGREERRIRWECFEELSNHERIDSISFRELEMGLSKLLDAVGIQNPHSETFASPVPEELLQIFMVVSSRFHTENNGDSFTEKRGEGKRIHSQASESLWDIGVGVDSELPFILVDKTNLKGSLRDIHTYIKGFREHRSTSFYEYLRYLVDPFFSDGYYPPGLSAQSTSCNQISPSESGEPSSLSCSWHTRNEGLPDTLTVLNSKSSVNLSKLRILII